ncbi:Uncharacterised protein [Yersinia frederiksenii]|nr:Uncharacterised protein [Yersinia frederiksenii]
MREVRNQREFSYHSIPYKGPEAQESDDVKCSIIIELLAKK